MTWTSVNKKYYIDKGYSFTKMKDKFIVNVEDLPMQSHAKVLIKCDYCGKEYKISYQNYTSRSKIIDKDACSECKNIKGLQTVIEKFGVNNYFATEDFKVKHKQRCLEKYGVEYYTQTEEMKEKAKNTCLERYGKPSFTQTEEYKQKTIQTNLKKRGYEYHTQDPTVIKKIMQSFYCNDSGKCSKPQKQLYDLLIEIYGNCELNFPCEFYSLDCYIKINNIKIDIEYDGEYWHKDKGKKDYIRDKFVRSKGYKILRIIGNRQIPTKENLINAINVLVDTDNYFLKIYTDIISDIK